MHWTMKLPPPSQGIPYLPDGYDSDERTSRPWPLGVRIVVFLGCYIVLQALYARCIGTAVERFFLEILGSRPAAMLIDLLQPALDVRVRGSRVTAPGGGINIGNGCEGTDLYFLLFAAFAAVSLSWRTRVIGLGMGLALAFVLNQARIVALFHAYRMDPAWFNLLHTTVAPVVLVVAIALYFHAWLRHCQRPAAIAP